MTEESLSEHMKRVQGPASYWIDEVKQLEDDNKRKARVIGELAEWVKWHQTSPGLTPSPTPLSPDAKEVINDTTAPSST